VFQSIGRRKLPREGKHFLILCYLFVSPLHLKNNIKTLNLIQIQQGCEFNFLPQMKQERITFHRGANFTSILISKGPERSTVSDKSTKVSHAQETRLFDLSKDLINLLSSNLEHD
jgi:hypothetical protein